MRPLAPVLVFGASVHIRYVFVFFERPSDKAEGRGPCVGAGSAYSQGSTVLARGLQYCAFRMWPPSAGDDVGGGYGTVSVEIALFDDFDQFPSLQGSVRGHCTRLSRELNMTVTPVFYHVNDTESTTLASVKSHEVPVPRIPQK